MGKDFMMKTPKVIATKAKIDEWHLNKLKTLCTVKENYHQSEQTPTEWDKMCAIYPSDKGLLSGVYKELKQTYKK